MASFVNIFDLNCFHKTVYMQHGRFSAKAQGCFAKSRCICSFSMESFSGKVKILILLNG